MNNTIRTFTFAFLTALFANTVFAQETTMEVIAGYVNDEVHRQKEGKFIGDILSAAMIKWVSVGSAGMSVDVFPKDSDRARYLLAKALIKQPMHITLSVKSDSENRYLVISPQDVIKQYEALKAEQDAAANP